MNSFRDWWLFVSSQNISARNNSACPDKTDCLVDHQVNKPNCIVNPSGANIRCSRRWNSNILLLLPLLISTVAFAGIDGDGIPDNADLDQDYDGIINDSETDFAEGVLTVTSGVAITTTPSDKDPVGSIGDPLADNITDVNTDQDLGTIDLDPSFAVIKTHSLLVLNLDSAFDVKSI